jgi:hypothetical protein
VSDPDGTTRTAVGTAALLATVATVTAAPGASSGASSATTLIHDCSAFQLDVHIARWALGTTHTGGYIAFTNRSRSSCRLTGWPTLVAETAAGATTVARDVRSTWYGPYVKSVPVLTLRHGQTAEAAFSGSDRPRNRAGTCPAPFWHLRVTPPGTSRSVVLSAWFRPLGRYLPSCGPLEVSMVVPRSAFGP